MQVASVLPKTSGAPLKGGKVPASTDVGGQLYKSAPTLHCVVLGQAAGLFLQSAMDGGSASLHECWKGWAHLDSVLRSVADS